MLNITKEVKGKLLNAYIRRGKISDQQSKLPLSQKKSKKL